MQVIQINSLTGHSPYDITICDITNTYCYSGLTGVTSVPVTIDLPTELLGTNEILVVVTDSIGCQEIQYHECTIPPTPTPTPTVTPTITPTNPVCNCISIENPSGITLNFGYTQCNGTLFYGEIYSATTLFVCGSQPYGDSGLTITFTSNACINEECPGPTPTPTTTPTPTPTLPSIVGYFQDGCDTSYEFTLSDIPSSFSPLSGVYYIESSGYVGCATYIGSTTSTNFFTFVAMGSQPNLYHCQKANFIYPCPTLTPTPSITPTLTPTPTVTMTVTPTTTMTPTPTTSMKYSRFRMLNCCDAEEGIKNIKFMSLPQYFLPGTSVVDNVGNCWRILSTSSVTPNEYWNHGTTYVDCELCIKYQTCTPTISSFISVWVTTTTNESIMLPYESSGSYSGTIDWGDGNTSINSYANRAHTYTTPGTYTITINGTLIGWSFYVNPISRLKIYEVLQWGCLRLGNSSGYFYECTNLTLSNVSDILDLTGTSNLFFMFAFCNNITTIQNINSWDTSNVTIMTNMFVECYTFNDDISGWDVSNVTDFGGMFDNAYLFDQPIGVWDTSNAANMASMFFYTTNFNQNIGSWDVSNVTNMSSMFNSSSFNNNGSPSISGWSTSNVTNMSNMFVNTPFNQNIDNWVVSNVTDMSYMFYQASSFNQPLNSWNVSSVTNMEAMFENATLFNQPLNNWNTSNVVDMGRMFRNNHSFNQNIGSWNVSNVTDMQLMFQGVSLSNPFNNGGSPSISGWSTSNVTNMFGMFNSNNAFNQDIGNWDVSNVTTFGGMFLVSQFNNGSSPSISGWTINTTSNVSMYWMFRAATSFNQPIGSWNVSKVTIMESMFHGATSFDQNIGGWNVSGVTNFNNFMLLKTFSDYSTTNLDAIYNGWSSLPSVQPSININFGTIKYTAGGSAGKAILQGPPNNWTITDGGI
ncbi:MAG: BspA family leucine-rich repeat surface protein [Bacteroidetes bacterium]|nr:BspA family leucine-rich repeat surface protein [Bacteroidota bacterium]